ncbi:flagellar hook capping FlgD N-terminal domain-containing protein [Pseudooceanicola sp. HF7]|uniref:flagellar hook capping FlgD N-terminal domain-containing protein n=1 Tax=Pseudooceanicola sp. HF7 TaxID=2721560 RepID=UPI00142F4478|nr:flagellar hook capping FlgD N-terminal domain-containing protein [Pseudooceanicola sp. HF7]NIZ09743.1 flagellar basal body rod modification protein [Pseudooceanicola sp. HF7]
MAIVTQATAAQGAAQTAATARAASADAPPKAVISSDFETFLQMLSTQLRNQDPMNPVESSDYAVQLATFSSVEQQVLTNNLLEGLTGKLVSSGMSDLAGWVGMEARSTAPAWFDGDPISISPNPLTAADTAILKVRNAAGTEVFSGEVPISDTGVLWDGKNNAGASLPHGSYTFELENYQQGDLLSVDPVESYTRITEARIVDGKTMLVTEAGDLLPTDLVSGLRQAQPATAG